MPEIIDPPINDDRHDIELILKAYDIEYSLENYTPSKIEIKRRTKLPLERVNQLISDHMVNPKTSQSKFYIEPVIERLFSIVKNTKSKNSEITKAADVLLRNLTSSEDHDTGGNTFKVNVITSNADDIREQVELRTAEIKESKG